MAVDEKASYRKCNFYQGLVLGIRIKTGVVRKSGVEDASRGCGPSKRRLMCDAAHQLHSHTVHTQSYCLRAPQSLPASVLSNRGGHLLQCSSPTFTWLARLPPSMHPTFIEQLLHPFGHFARDLRHKVENIQSSISKSILVIYKQKSSPLRHMPSSLSPLQVWFLPLVYFYSLCT